MKLTYTIAVIALTFALMGCGPVRVDPIEEINSSETAFVVPLEGDTSGQAKFDSVELYESAKVAAKRVTISQRKRKIGRSWRAYEWVPTVRLIKVNRKPITVNWSKSGDQALCVESKDSIAFCTGTDLTAEIHEEDASTYLYNYGDKDLSAAINEDVRSFLISVVTREFGSRDLVTGKEEKGKIMETAKAEVVEHFATKGITVTNLGLTGGLNYIDPAIQEAINRTFVAEQDAATATEEAKAETARAEIVLEKAKGEAAAAKEWATSLNARQAQIRLEIEKMNAQARLAWAQKWNGELPASILPQGSELIMSFDEAPTQ